MTGLGIKVIREQAFCRATALSAWLMCLKHIESLMKWFSEQEIAVQGPAAARPVD